MHPVIDKFTPTSRVFWMKFPKCTPMFDKFTLHFCVFGCFLFETSQNFTDSMAMGIKHFEVVKQRSHADKQWSSDEIRV